MSEKEKQKFVRALEQNIAPFIEAVADQAKEIPDPSQDKAPGNKPG
jgi:hypothetical protein